MILLDPELDPDPSPQSAVTKPVAPKGISTRSLGLFLRKAQTAVRLRGQVSVLLTTDNAIRRLNRQFRGKNKATDVLSFPSAPLQSAKAAERVAGDLAISIHIAQKQASACGHSLGTELKVLVLHGLLHLAGYDHEADSGEMARREAQLRAKFGLPLGLIERASSQTAIQQVDKSAIKSAKSPRPKARSTAGGRPLGPRRKSAANQRSRTL